jgi:hypothetical protein
MRKKNVVVIIVAILLSQLVCLWVLSGKGGGYLTYRPVDSGPVAGPEAPRGISFNLIGGSFTVGISRVYRDPFCKSYPSHGEWDAGFVRCEQRLSSVILGMGAPRANMRVGSLSAEDCSITVAFWLLAAGIALIGGVGYIHFSRSEITSDAMSEGNNSKKPAHMTAGDAPV